MQSIRLHLNIPSLAIPTPVALPSPSMSAITTASSVLSNRAVPTQQMHDASLREIRFQRLRLKDLLFWVQQIQALMSIFSRLPLRESLERGTQNTRYYRIDWNAAGLSQFQDRSNQIALNEVASQIENRTLNINQWFSEQVAQLIDKENEMTAQQLSNRFEAIDLNILSTGFLYNLRSDLRVSSALREFDRDLYVIADHQRSFESAKTTYFTWQTNPLHGEPNIFNLLSHAILILREAIAFQAN